MGETIKANTIAIWCDVSSLSGNAWFGCTSPIKGRWVGVCGGFHTAHTGATTVLTPTINGVDNPAEAFDALATIGVDDALCQRFSKMAAMDVEPGDTLELESDTAGTGGGSSWIFLIETAEPMTASVVGHNLDAIGTANDIIHLPVTHPGRLKAVSFFRFSAVTVDIPVITIQKNGVSTGLTFTVPIAGNRTGGVFELTPAQMDLAEYEKGDVISLESDGTGTGTLVFFNCLFETRPGDDGSGADLEIPVYINSTHSGTASVNTGRMGVPARCQVIGFYGVSQVVASEEQVLTVQINGTDVSPAVTVTNPTTAVGTAHPPEILSGGADAIVLEEGDCLCLESDGAGSTGESTWFAVVRAA
jgi:hypothetical protein